jgi:hypothetical protein
VSEIKLIPERGAYFDKHFLTGSFNGSYEIRAASGSQLVRLTFKISALQPDPGAPKDLSARRREIEETLTHRLKHWRIPRNTEAQDLAEGHVYRLFDMQDFVLLDSSGEQFTPIWCVSPIPSLTVVYGEEGKPASSFLPNPANLPDFWHATFRATPGIHGLRSGLFVGLLEVGHAVDVSLLFEVPSGIRLQELRLQIEDGRPVPTTWERGIQVSWQSLNDKLTILTSSMAWKWHARRWDDRIGRALDLYARESYDAARAEVETANKIYEAHPSQFRAHRYQSDHPPFTLNRSHEFREFGRHFSTYLETLVDLKEREQILTTGDMDIDKLKDLKAVYLELKVAQREVYQLFNEATLDTPRTIAKVATAFLNRQYDLIHSALPEGSEWNAEARLGAIREMASFSRMCKELGDSEQDPAFRLFLKERRMELAEVVGSHVPPGTMLNAILTYPDEDVPYFTPITIRGAYDFSPRYATASYRWVSDPMAIMGQRRIRGAAFLGYFFEPGDMKSWDIRLTRAREVAHLQDRGVDYVSSNAAEYNTALERMKDSMLPSEPRRALLIWLTRGLNPSLYEELYADVKAEAERNPLDFSLPTLDFEIPGPLEGLCVPAFDAASHRQYSECMEATTRRRNKNAMEKIRKMIDDIRHTYRTRIKRDVEIRGYLVPLTPEIELQLPERHLQEMEIRGIFIPEEAGQEGNVDTYRVDEWIGTKKSS